MDCVVVSDQQGNSMARGVKRKGAEGATERQSDCGEMETNTVDRARLRTRMRVGLWGDLLWVIRERLLGQWKRRPGARQAFRSRWVRVPWVVMEGLGRALFWGRLGLSRWRRLRRMV